LGKDLSYKLRSQETGKRIYRRKPATEWRRTEIPEQRIISDELWNAAQQRMQIVNELYALEARRPGILRARAATSPYIFSGLLKCSLCGASITIVSGRSRKRQDVRYGCSLHYHRGRDVCPNTLLIARRALEEQLLAGLRAKVLHPDVMAYTLDGFEEQLLLAANRRGEESAVMQRRLETIQKQIRNCTDAIAEGKRSPSLMERLSELEQELADTKAKILYSEPREVKLRLRDVRRFAEARLKHLLRGNHASRGRKLGSTFKKSRSHRRAAPISLQELGMCWERGSMGGAGGQNRTGYARLFRAALYQ
jgi:site-specific DNA recombinase